MNTITGELYEGLFAIEQARERGESVVEIGPKVVNLLRAEQRTLDSEAHLREIEERLGQLEREIIEKARVSPYGIVKPTLADVERFASTMKAAR